MTEKEIEIVSKIGSSAFTLYSYIKKFPRRRGIDMQVDLNMSDRTVIKVLKKLQDTNIIKRHMLTNKIREIRIMPEQEWRL